MKTLGIDWGHRELVGALLGEDGTFDWQARIATRDAPSLLLRLEAWGGPGVVRIALEAGAPLLPELFAAHGYEVEELSPDRVEKMRALHYPGGAKDDARDAKTIARMAHHRELGLHPVRVPAQRAETLALLSRCRVRLVRKRTVAIQQLVDLVRRAHPGLAALDLDFTRGYALALVEAYPDPRRAQRAQLAKIARLLKQGRARNLQPQTVYHSLREHGFVVPQHVAQVCALEAPLLVEQVRMLSKQIKQAESAIAAAYQDHPDAAILRSLPGCGATLAPSISARIDSGVVRQLGSKQAQILAGTAPSTCVSGKRRGGHVKRRRACDRDLHQVLILLARTSLRSSVWARAFVQHHTGGRVRDRKRMNRALRALANKWVRIIHTLLLRGEAYDEQRHIEQLRRNAVPWAPESQAAA